jgi:hypothetical protein
VLLLQVVFATLLVALVPDPAWAWGPATHIYLGATLLDHLFLVPDSLRALLAAYPNQFLYGSVAADISLAKKYVPAGRHCHHWHIGEEILAHARDDALRAVGYGYLAHLAADTIAHNVYVPRQLLLTSSSKGLGHAYWEARMDSQLGERWTRRARQVIVHYDHSAADALFDEVLSDTLFSFRTNRRIFRGMIRVQDNDRWHAVFGAIVGSSRWQLPPETIHAYVERSFDYVVDYLNRRGESLAAGLDPIGERNLAMSKQVRRIAMRDGAAERPGLLMEMADEFFPLPEVPFGHLQRITARSA